jgi:hypothetical protein
MSRDHTRDGRGWIATQAMLVQLVQVDRVVLVDAGNGSSETRSHPCEVDQPGVVGNHNRAGDAGTVFDHRSRIGPLCRQL